MKSLRESESQQKKNGVKCQESPEDGVGIQLQSLNYPSGVRRMNKTPGPSGETTLPQRPEHQYRFAKPCSLTIHSETDDLDEEISPELLQIPPVSSSNCQEDVEISPNSFLFEETPESTSELFSIEDVRRSSNSRSTLDFPLSPSASSLSWADSNIYASLSSIEEYPLGLSTSDIQKPNVSCSPNRLEEICSSTEDLHLLGDDEYDLVNRTIPTIHFFGPEPDSIEINTNDSDEDLSEYLSPPNSDEADVDRSKHISPARTFGVLQETSADPFPLSPTSPTLSELTDFSWDQFLSFGESHEKDIILRRRRRRSQSPRKMVAMKFNRSRKASRQSFHEEDLLKPYLSQSIKDEIRCKIQLRRINTGQEELKVNFPEQRPTISYDAVKKRHEVRERNKHYAKISRDRVKQERRALEDENKKLLAERSELQKDVSNLKHRLSTIKRTLHEHSETCPMRKKILEDVPPPRTDASSTKADSKTSGPSRFGNHFKSVIYRMQRRRPSTTYSSSDLLESETGDRSKLSPCTHMKPTSVNTGHKVADHGKIKQSHFPGRIKNTMMSLFPRKSYDVHCADEKFMGGNDVGEQQGNACANSKKSIWHSPKKVSTVPFNTSVEIWRKTLKTSPTESEKNGLLERNHADTLDKLSNKRLKSAESEKLKKHFSSPYYLYPELTGSPKTFTVLSKKQDVLSGKKNHHNLEKRGVPQTLGRGSIHEVRFNSW